MRLFKLVSVVATLGLAIGTAQAGDAGQGKAEINKCRACHDGRQAVKLSPAGKTRKQWGRYFKDDYKKLVKKHVEWESFGYSDEMLQEVQRFLVEHALDSDKPQTCD